MDELLETLTMKLSKASDLCANLEKIENEFKKLDEEERKALPKFRGKLDEESLNKYLKKLTQAVKNPIRFKRKKELRKLGITGIDNVRDEVFDNDDIEETIKIMVELKSYERLFKVLSHKFTSLLIKSSINSLNKQLEGIRSDIESLKKIEEIKSEDVKDYILRKYINEYNEEFRIYQINEIIKKVIEVERALNLQIKQDEISLIDDVYKLINDVRVYGRNLSMECVDLHCARSILKNLKYDLEQEYKQTKKEINFWRELCLEVYVQETKDINILIEKLDELKKKCKEDFASFIILKQIYSQNLSEEIEEAETLKEFANKLNKVISYITNIEIKNRKDLQTVREVSDSIEWLEKIEYPDVKELFEGFMLENISIFFEKMSKIKEEYEHLKEYSKLYQRILRVKKEQIDAYPLLRQGIDEYRNDLQKKIGAESDSIIRFLRGETENIEADEQTLKSFIEVAKPFLKEVLEI